jgi:hypothetical protein
MATNDPDDLADDVTEDVTEDVLPEARRDRDGIAALRDVEEEQGDELAVHDTYDMDAREARQLGVQLDALDAPEPDLD